MQVKSEREVAESCPVLSDPIDCSLPGSSVHGIFQAGALEWGAIAFSEGVYLGEPKGASLVAQMVKRLPVMRETQVQSLCREDLLEKEMETYFSILPGKSHGSRSLVGHSP